MTLDDRAVAGRHSDGAIPLRPRCKTCAYTEGTPANQSDLTRLKSELCVVAYEPFYCHENMLPDDTLPEGKEHLCRGWAESVRGQPYPEQWKRKVALRLLKVADDLETRPDATEAEIKAAVCQAVLELA